YELCACVELHVFFVPDEQWNSRLNKVSVEAIDSFISAGFIRVYPDISLKTVRDELGALLGLDRITDKYCFLKCVGRSLALVSCPQRSPYPELYLLPVDEHGSSLCSSSLSPDTVIYNADTQSGYPPRPVFAPVQTKEPIKFPLIKQGPQSSVLDQSLEDEGSFSSLEEREEVSVGCEDPIWTDVHNISRSVQEEFGTKQHDGEKHILLLFRTVHRHGNELLKELALVKEERKQLEKTRQELLRKGKELLALNRHRRNQARDKWKRKYFDTKKATAPLEEALKSLRQELETFYDKLFQQLQARDGRNRQRRTGNPSSTKNNLIIQIMTESWEIDNLKKNLDDAKMKLVTETKLKKQAATELRALKAELMQKKSQCSITGQLLGNND
uniref:Spermatogenesis associated 1 n=1 Tax=Astyanax mexicanus TaxID=7994 RepID=A0A3B1IPD1_ASTMX